jgi:hypothetical protein
MRPSRKHGQGGTGGLPTHTVRVHFVEVGTVAYGTPALGVKRCRRHAAGKGQSAEGTVPATVQTRSIADATVITVPVCTRDSRSRFRATGFSAWRTQHARAVPLC